MQDQRITHTYLIQQLELIASERRGWNSIPAQELLAYAEQALAPLARREGFDPADAVNAAWELWSRPAMLQCENAWAYTRTVVKKELGQEKWAQNAQTSRAGLERQGIADLVGIADNGLDSVENRTVANHDKDDAPAEFKTLAFRTAAELLAQAGLDRGTADAVLNSIAEQGATCSSPAQAFDKSTREKAVPAALGIELSTWRSVCALLLGNWSNDIGLLEAERNGIDPQTVRNVRTSTKRLLRAV